MSSILSRLQNRFKEYTPKLIICLREGYSKRLFSQDFIAGITVGIISLPLTMAFAIASGVAPERGLFTAIVGGLLIALLGGSRVQIAGPTGAFVVVIYSVVERHGYDGLCIASLIAAFMILILGLVRAGVLLKFVSHSVTVGFTSGIALAIFTSQIKDFFGLEMAHTPVDFLEKWRAYAGSFHTVNPWTVLIGFSALIIIYIFRRAYPKIPGAIVAVFLTAFAVSYFDLPVATIKSKFGAIPHMLPTPALPAFSFEKVQAVFNDAITIAFLGAIESLLSAAVADGMTGNRHRSNCELFAQGIANIGTILFGGVPSTGAVARTSTNIKMGAKTPIAGAIAALTILVLMLFFSSFAVLIPLPTLAAILVFVAWNMSEIDNVVDIFKSSKSDSAVFFITFALTVLIDLTVAVEVGVILSCILFLKNMSDSTSVKACQLLIAEDKNPDLTDSHIVLRKDVPDDVTVFEIDGPLFFGTANTLSENLYQLNSAPRAFILRMRRVSLIDATGIHALKQFDGRCRDKGILFLLSGVSKEIGSLLKKTGVETLLGKEHIFLSLDDALSYLKTARAVPAPEKLPLLAPGK